LIGAAKLNAFTLDAYNYGLRRDAHQLLAWGHQDAFSVIHCNLEEEEITGLIVVAMREKLKDSSLPTRFDRYSVGEEKPLAVEGRTGKSRRKLDIVVESSLPRAVKPEYVFEAKRLRKNGYPISKYIGKDGLQCFVNGVYASEYSEAAMVGYLQSGSASYWEAELARKLSDDTKNELKIKCSLCREQDTSAIVDSWHSQHERAGNVPITVYHLFLDCSALFNE
jgi:hypothetical protein